MYAINFEFGGIKLVRRIQFVDSFTSKKKQNHKIQQRRIYVTFLSRTVKFIFIKVFFYCVTTLKMLT